MNSLKKKSREKYSLLAARHAGYWLDLFPGVDVGHHLFTCPLEVRNVESVAVVSSEHVTEIVCPHRTLEDEFGDKCHLIGFRCGPADFGGHVSILALPLGEGCRTFNQIADEPEVREPTPERNYWRLALGISHSFTYFRIISIWVDTILKTHFSQGFV